MHTPFVVCAALAAGIDALVAGSADVVLGALLEDLRGGSGVAVYGLVTATLLLGACGVPIPEEAVFAVGGALAASGRASLAGVYVVGWTTVLVLDLVLHGLGARYGPPIMRSRLGRRVGSRRWAFLRRFVARRGVWAVLGARFVMGARIPAFLLAGAMGMPRGRFLAVVALAGLVSAAIPTALGYAFGAHLDSVLEALAAARWGLFVVFVAALAWWLLRRSP